MKQTAVEWLEKQIKKFHNWKINPVFDENCFDEIELAKAIQKAKEIEKQQIIEAYKDGVVGTKLAEEYYNKTFNK